jgi:D-galactarolactone cycloisomerase
MKIKAVNTHQVKFPLKEPFGFSQFYYAQRENLLVEVVAEDGTSGWGECYGPAAPVRAAIDKLLAPMLTGQDCLDIELLWHEIWRRFMDYARYGSIIAGLSGVDIALWDLKGKLLGQPLYKLLGGSRDKEIPCYATGHYFRQVDEERALEIILDEAANNLESGFLALKIKTGKNMAFDLRLIRKVRERFPEAMLLADANHAYSLSEAVRLGRVLDELDYRFFEEPLAPHAFEQFKMLRAKLDLPLATGECEQTRFGFRRLLESGGADIIQPDLAHCGGISEGLKIRAMANAMGVDVTPHAWGTWIGFAAALHFHATCPPNPGKFEPEPLYLECDNSENPAKERLFSRGIEIKKGRAVLPDEPGLGIEVDLKALKQ